MSGDNVIYGPMGHLYWSSRQSRKDYEREFCRPAAELNHAIRFSRVVAYRADWSEILLWYHPEGVALVGRRVKTGSLGYMRKAVRAANWGGRVERAGFVIATAAPSTGLYGQYHDLLDRYLGTAGYRANSADRYLFRDP